MCALLKRHRQIAGERRCLAMPHSTSPLARRLARWRGLGRRLGPRCLAQGAVMVPTGVEVAPSVSIFHIVSVRFAAGENAGQRGWWRFRWRARRGRHGAWIELDGARVPGVAGYEIDDDAGGSAGILARAPSWRRRRAASERAARAEGAEKPAPRGGRGLVPGR